MVNPNRKHLWICGVTKFLLLILLRIAQLLNRLKLLLPQAILLFGVHCRMIRTNRVPEFINLCMHELICNCCEFLTHVLSESRKCFEYKNTVSINSIKKIP
jgi:hypothetical protein